MWQSSCISNAYLLWCYHEFERFTWWFFYLPLLQFIGAQPWNRHDFTLHRWFLVPFILCTQVKLSVVLSRSASFLFWFNLFTSSQAINHHTHRIKKMHVKHFIEHKLWWFELFQDKWTDCQTTIPVISNQRKTFPSLTHTWVCRSYFVGRSNFVHSIRITNNVSREREKRSWKNILGKLILSL